jgi:hypothetical protein
MSRSYTSSSPQVPPWRVAGQLYLFLYSPTLFVYPHSIPMSAKWAFPYRYSDQNIVCISQPSYSHYMSSPSHSSWSGHSENNLRRVQTMTLIIMHFLHLPITSSLRSKYFHQCGSFTWVIRGNCSDIVIWRRYYRSDNITKNIQNSVIFVLRWTNHISYSSDNYKLLIR